MAKKLRWHMIRQSVGDGTSSEDNGARHTNEAENDMLIRQIHATIVMVNAEAAESGSAQLSTQNTFNQVDDEDEFRLQIEVTSQGSTTGAAVDDASWRAADHWYFDRGQLVLETGETLFSSVQKTSGGVVSINWLLGYEFDE